MLEDKALISKDDGEENGRIRHQHTKAVSDIDLVFCDLPRVKQQESSMLFLAQYDKSKTNFLYKYHIRI